MTSERSEQGVLATPFAKVAEIIAKGEPPEWLVSALTTLGAINPNAEITPAIVRQYKRRLSKMQEAVDTLIELFPMFNREFDGMTSAQAPVFQGFEESLGQLQSWLAAIGDNDRGRRPHPGKELCADIVVNFWKRIHGKASPRSDHCYLACEEFWRACGGAPSGDIQNWRRMVELASTRDELFLSHNMLIRFVGTDIRSK
jgi:hypothetical protein